MSLEKAETKNSVKAWIGVSLKALYRGGSAPSFNPSVCHFDRKTTPFVEKGTDFHMPTLEHRIPFLNPWNEVRNNVMTENQALLEKKLTKKKLLFVKVSRYSDFSTVSLSFLYFNSVTPLGFNVPGV